jgi:hypothetical protein
VFLFFGERRISVRLEAVESGLDAGFGGVLFGGGEDSV